jgi:hypothetical protein
MIRIGAAEALAIGNAGTNALAIGNAGTFVELKFDNSAITLVDILSITRGRHSIRTGGGIISYRTNVTSNNNRRGAIGFNDSALNSAFANFLLGQATSSVNGEGINTRFMRAADYSLFLQDDWKLSQKLTSISACATSLTFRLRRGRAGDFRPGALSTEDGRTRAVTLSALLSAGSCRQGM